MLSKLGSVCIEYMLRFFLHDVQFRFPCTSMHAFSMGVASDALLFSRPGRQVIKKQSYKKIGFHRYTRQLVCYIHVFRKLSGSAYRLPLFFNEMEALPCNGTVMDTCFVLLERYHL